MKYITHTNNFKELIESNSYYVDKTDAIEELLKSSKCATFFTRPYKFGKSLFISMLDNFLNIEYKDINKNLFDDLKISKSEYYKHLSKYPVIVLNLESLNQDNYADMFKEFKKVIMKLYDSKRYLLDDMDKYEEKYFREFLDGSDEAIYSLSLRDLSKYLYKYYKIKVIILVDGLDKLGENASKYGYFKEMNDFIDHLFECALKTSEYVDFSILTSVLRPSTPGDFHGFNNVDFQSMEDKFGNNFFGFTESEVMDLLNYYGLELNDEVKNMYGGYKMYDLLLYQPFSILNYVKTKELKSYFDGSNLLKDFIKNCDGYRKEYIEVLLLDEKIRFRYRELITYADINKDMFNIMFAEGVVTVDEYVDDPFGGYLKVPLVKLPNKEVKEWLEKIIK